MDYILHDDFFLPIAPVDVSAVARSTLEFFICLFLVVQACFSTRRCFSLHFSSLRATSFVIFVHCHVVSGHAAIRALKQNALSSVLRQKPLAVVAGGVLTVTKCRLLLSWEKNQTMRQQAYYCVISAICRHQYTVNTRTKRSCHTVCWLNLLRAWEIPTIMTSSIKWGYFVPHFQRHNAAFVYRSEFKRWSVKRERGRELKTAWVENENESAFNQVCYLNASSSNLGLFSHRPLQRNEPSWNTLFKICLLILIEETIDVSQFQSLVWTSILLVAKVMAFW